MLYNVNDTYFILEKSIHNHFKQKEGWIEFTIIRIFKFDKY